MISNFNASFGAQLSAFNRAVKKTPLFKGSNPPRDPNSYITQDTERLPDSYYARQGLQVPGSTQPLSSDYYQQRFNNSTVPNQFVLPPSQQYQPMYTQSPGQNLRESSYAPTEISQDQGYTYPRYPSSHSTPLPADPNLQAYQSSPAWKKPASNQDHELLRAERYVGNPQDFEITPSPPLPPSVSSQEKRTLIQNLAQAIRATQASHATRTHHRHLQGLRDELQNLGNASLINEIERAAAALASRR
jgi:hypothetical protein